MKTDTCTKDSDCPQGLICVDGKCVKDPFGIGKPSKNSEEEISEEKEESEDEG